MQPLFKIRRLSLDEVRTPETEELLSECIYDGKNPERRSIAMAFYNDPKGCLIGARQEDGLLGLIGLVPKGTMMEIRHIAVRAAFRRCGIGKDLIKYARLIFPSQILIAETDKDSIGFYQKCGFKCISLGEKYPGIERFECTLAS